MTAKTQHRTMTGQPLAGVGCLCRLGLVWAGMAAALLLAVLPVAAQTHPASPSGQPVQKRVAFIIGIAAYPSGPLKTAANDAGLIGQTLQAAGFDVVGARDLDAEMLRRSFRDFLDKATAAGPDTVAVVYLAGYGLQFDGENYVVPVDARIARDVDAPIESIRIADLLRPLAALPLRASIVVLDLARPLPFAKTGTPIQGGLALMEPDARILLAFNSSPGVVAPYGSGEFGAYALALDEMMREGGLPIDEVFNRVRLRVNEASAGAEVPWHAARLDVPFSLFEAAASAPPPAVDVQAQRERRERPIADLDARDAYLTAIEKDTVPAYEAFLRAYPRDPMAGRVKAVLAARREAITWSRARNQNEPEAYWTYRNRYPRGPHAAEARRRIARLTAPPAPPRGFAEVDFQIGPPIEEEVIFVSRPVLSYADPDFGFAPPPPLPLFFLPPPPPPIRVLTLSTFLRNMSCRPRSSCHCRSMSRRRSTSRLRRPRT